MFGKIPNSDVALELLSTLGVGSSRRLSAKTRKILTKSNQRTDVLKMIVSLIPFPETPKELYIVSTAYVWLGAKYRKEAIEYLKKYIEVGACWGELMNGTITSWGWNQSRADFNRARVFCDLGLCYEKEYMFDEAISAFEKGRDLDGYSAYCITKIADVYVKKNDYEKAFETLNKAKKSKYYKIYTHKNAATGTISQNKDFIYSIDKTLESINEKYNKGYKYKPRVKN